MPAPADLRWACLALSLSDHRLHDPFRLADLHSGGLPGRPATHTAETPTHHCSLPRTQQIEWGGTKEGTWHPLLPSTCPCRPRVSLACTSYLHLIGNCDKPIVYLHLPVLRPLEWRLHQPGAFHRPRKTALAEEARDKHLFVGHTMVELSFTACALSSAPWNGPHGRLCCPSRERLSGFSDTSECRPAAGPDLTVPLIELLLLPRA